MASLLWCLASWILNMEGKEVTQPMSEFYLEIAHWPVDCKPRIGIGGARLGARRLDPMRSEVGESLGHLSWASCPRH